MLHRSCVSAATLHLFAILATTVVGLTYEEWRAGADARGHTWPVPDDRFQPNTPEWKQLMRDRIMQAQAYPNDDRNQKFLVWKNAMNQAVVLPNFTEYGWGVTRAPSDLVEEIQYAFRAGLDSAHQEGDDPCIVGGQKETVLVDIGDLPDRALVAMMPYAEAWTGIKLRPITSYGLRAYSNNTQLYMHLDRMDTHIISVILHIDRSEDYRRGSFPLVIEDFEGTTRHVYLDRGDALLYESAKCLHGRPIPLDGSWFTSLFLHFAPHDWPIETQELEAQYAVPKHFEDVTPYDEARYDLPMVSMVDTGMIQPDCPNQWCGSSKPVVWEGPAKPGVITTSHGKEQVLNMRTLEA